LVRPKYPGKEKPIDKEAPKKPGPKPVDFNEEVLAQIEEYASRQWLDKDIAVFLGYSQSHFYALKAIHPSISDAIKRGQKRGIDAAIQTLERCMKKDNVVASMFYLKCKGGWKDNGDDTTGDDGRDKESVSKSVQNALRKLIK